MRCEVERKFRITYVPARYLRKGKRIVQAYLSFTPEVRIRISGIRAYITIKSTGSLIRDEFEYRIPLEDAKHLLKLCKKKIVKTRYRSGGFIFDVYHRALQGLIIAEHELKSIHQHVFLPKDIIGFEVTRNSKYKNRNLCRYQKVPSFPKKSRSP